MQTVCLGQVIAVMASKSKRGCCTKAISAQLFCLGEKIHGLLKMDR